MGTIDQITYRARAGGGRGADTAATSIADKAQLDRWQRVLEPLVVAGRPLGRAYLNFGTQAALVRWYAEAGSRADWQYALALIDQSDTLTAGYALELPDLGPDELSQSGGQAQLWRTEHGPGHDAIAAKARSADAVALLTPLLAHGLNEVRQVNMPWTERSLPEAVMWALAGILDMIADRRPLSFHTYERAGSRIPAADGLFVSFRPDVTAVPPPDPGLRALAALLVALYTAGPAVLRRALSDLGPLPDDHASKISRLFELRPSTQTETTHTGETRNVQPARTDSDQAVMCPMCLHEIQDWGRLNYWHWDVTSDTYVPLVLPPELNEAQRGQRL